MTRLIGGTLILLSAVGCGSDLLRTGRSPLFLTIMSIEGSSGNSSTFTSFLQSDVQTIVDVTTAGVTRQVATVFNDNVRVTLRAEAKDPSIGTAPINSITMTRYHVEFRRSDGRNRPGVDVPFPFDGALGVTVAPGTPTTVSFEIVRHQAKLEPPLSNMVGFGGLGFLSTVADITLYGRDQNGNEVVARGSIDVHFGDFGDSQ